GGGLHTAYGWSARCAANARSQEMKMPHDLHLERQRGLALVVVLWVVALLALQVSILNLTVRDTSSLATTELATLRGEALAMAGVEMAVAHLLARNPARRWGAD